MELMRGRGFDGSSKTDVEGSFWARASEKERGYGMGYGVWGVGYGMGE